MKKTDYCLNLWDDFTEVGLESKISIPGETSIKIECSEDLSLDEEKKILTHFLPLFEKFFNPRGVSLELYLYDSKIEHPHMSEALHADRGWRDFAYWQITLKSMTYKLNEEFMDDHENKIYEYEGKTVKIISES